MRRDKIKTGMARSFNALPQQWQTCKLPLTASRTGQCPGLQRVQGTQGWGQGHALCWEKSLTRAVAGRSPLSARNHLTTYMALNTKEALARCTAMWDCNFLRREFRETKLMQIPYSWQTWQRRTDRQDQNPGEKNNNLVVFSNPGIGVEGRSGSVLKHGAV